MKSSLYRIAALSAAALLLAGCANQRAPKESGFLGDYSQLREEQVPGGARLIYRDAALKPRQYTAMWLSPVEYYPSPQPSAQVSMETLTELQNYLDQSLRRKIGREIRLVNGPGPGVAKARIAITAVGSESEALAAYQYIPVALAVTGARAVLEGGRPQQATIAIESKVTDSQTGQLLWASVRGGTGERVRAIAQGQASVPASALKPLIDEWTDSVAREIRNYVRSK